MSEIILCCVPVKDFLSKCLRFLQGVRYNYIVDYKRGVLVLRRELMPGDDLKQVLVILRVINDMPPVLPLSLSNCSLESSCFF